MGIISEHSLYIILNKRGDLLDLKCIINPDDAQQSTRHRDAIVTSDGNNNNSNASIKSVYNEMISDDKLFMLNFDIE